ncbi:MAG: polymer-forming cytoskeletal protein [Candidatus Krumholzibacteria bacterium]|nr:polymer-forming cytoskeletal protein [Candidatus Krumholzibacteria bacterium]
MLSKKTTQLPTTNKPVDSIDTLVGQKASLKGDLEFSGGLRVDGKVLGSISATEGNGSTLVLSELGEIEGNVSVPHVVVNGVIKGNITSTGRVELQSKARVTGDVHYKAVEMELGATVNGNLVCEPAAASGTLKPVLGGMPEQEKFHHNSKL